MQPDIWINGSFVPWDEAAVHPLCHSLQRGSTVFESIDCNETDGGRAAIFRLREHMLRMENSALVVGMPMPYSVDELMDATVQTVARSGLKRCTIRPLAFYADVVFPIYPGDIPLTVVIGIGPSNTPPESYRVTVAGMRKIDDRSMPLKAKVSGNYIGPMMAKRDAVRTGFDDAVILDSDGFVAEGTTSNIFIVENGSLIATAEETILPGITRDSISSIARHLGVTVTGGKFTESGRAHV